MKTNEKPLAIFVLESNGVVIYSQKQPQGTSIQFPAGLIEHMEILNFDAVRDLLAQACATLELKDTPALLVFGQSLLFEKQIEVLPEDKLQLAIDQFRDSTPFERVASHAYKNAKGSLVVSMNRDFYDSLRQVLERCSVHVIGILPQQIFVGIAGAAPLQQKTLLMLTTKIDELVAESMVLHKVVPKTLQEKQEYISKKYSGLVVVIFVLFLLGVFALTGYILQSQFKSARKTAPTPAPTPVVQEQIKDTPLPLATPEAVASSSAIIIKIASVPENASVAAQLSKRLKAENFSQVTIQSQPGLQGNQPLVVFKSSLASANRNAIITVIKEIFPNVSIQELSELSSDVSITLGK